MPDILFSICPYGLHLDIWQSLRFFEKIDVTTKILTLKIVCDFIFKERKE